MFFDQQDVNAFVTPLSSDFTTDATIVAGSPLITTAAGNIEGLLKYQNIDSQDTQIQKFRTGETEFRMTSSSTRWKSWLVV